ncbi:hypothetical protein HDV00_008477 [Rhizophlyctis rosea]|nr:hypothetical protein HDV00_008477 [Rhizophlyctis rosea]
MSMPTVQDSEDSLKFYKRLVDAFSRDLDFSPTIARLQTIVDALLSRATTSIRVFLVAVVVLLILNTFLQGVNTMDVLREQIQKLRPEEQEREKRAISIPCFDMFLPFVRPYFRNKTRAASFRPTQTPTTSRWSQCHHISHFIPKFLVEDMADKHRVSRSTLRKVMKVINGEYNTSTTTAAWNQGQNRASERQIRKLWKDELTKGELDAGAWRRFREMAGAWRDVKQDVKDAAPNSLYSEMDRFFARAR